MTWAGVLVASAACYLLKLAGLSLPQSWLQDARIQRTVPLLPVALLAALIATLTFSTGHRLMVDVRAGRGPWRRGHSGRAAGAFPGGGGGRRDDRGAAEASLEFQGWRCASRNQPA